MFEINRELPEKKKLFVPAPGGKYDLAAFVQNWAAYCAGKNANGAFKRRDLARFAGMSYQRLFEINKTLEPEQQFFRKLETGDYDLEVFVQNWVEYRLREQSATEGKDLDTVKAEHELVKMRKTELQVAEMEGNLVDVNEVRRLWAQIASTIMQNMIRLPDKIAPMVLMLDNPEMIKTIIKTEISTVLNELSETPLPETAAKEEEEEDE